MKYILADEVRDCGTPGGMIAHVKRPNLEYLSPKPPGGPKTRVLVMLVFGVATAVLIGLLLSWLLGL